MNRFPVRSWYQRFVGAALSDLPLFAFGQCLVIVLAAFVAKWIAVAIAYGPLAWHRRAVTAVAVMPAELILFSIAAALALGSRYRRTPLRRGRVAVAAAVFTSAQIVMALEFIDVEFWGSWGCPLHWDLVRLAPQLAGYVRQLGLANAGGGLTAWACVAAVAVVAPGVVSARLAPIFVRGDRWTRAAWALVVVAGVAGVGLSAVRPHDVRDDMLRRLNPIAMFLSGPEASGTPTNTELSAADVETLAKLCAPGARGGALALAPLRGRRLNVVLWVWEAVGARLLRSLRPEGVARTPELDRIMARGSVSFSHAYAECPLTVQTTWALITGMSPPAKPYVFVHDDRMPPHGPVLQGELKRAGYQVGLHYSSYTRMWNTSRVYRLAPWDVFEDGDDLAKMGRYAENGIGVQDEAPVDRSLAWLAGLPSHAPFFAMLWSIETHGPYTWSGMPEALNSIEPIERYTAAVERADGLLGRYYRELEAQGRLEDTLIIVVGDHGEGFGRGGRSWDKSHGDTVYEDAISVPLIFLHPALGHETVGDLCTHADVYPTLLDLLGLPVPAGLDGASLAGPRPARPLFSRAISWWPLAARAGRYKLIASAPGGMASLYDVEADPFEQHDLQAEQPETRRLLYAALNGWNADRLRHDPTFGYRSPGLPRFTGGGIRSTDWVTPPPGH